MTTIIDKRKFARKSEAGNRKKLIERCKDGLRKVVDKAISDSKIKDIVKPRKVVGNGGVLDEPSFNHDKNTGNPKDVRGNNKEHHKGSTIRTRKDGEGPGNKAGNEFEEFTFILTEREFLDILFEDMELPDFIKESLNNETRYRWRRAGTTTDGPITKLNLEETLITALGRRFASKSGLKDGMPEPDMEKKIPYLTEEDLRYNLYIKDPIPIRKAVMFCMMDVSGSMGDHEKQLAKRFFLLLYLFLNREYEKVDIRFIIHNTEAREVDEDQFFSVSEGGGTIMTSGYKLIDDIITKEYDINKENIYLAQVSDGDDFEVEVTGTESGFLASQLLQKLQYFAYLEVNDANRAQFRQQMAMFGLGSTVYDTLEELKATFPQVNVAKASEITEIFPVLQNLFKKRGK